jgi:hypothetical protein
MNLHPMRCHLLYMQDRLLVGQTGLLAIAANPRIRVLVIQQVVLEAHEFRKRFLRAGSQTNWMKLYVLCPCR